VYDDWRKVELFVASGHDHDDAVNQVQSEIRLIACQAGESVHQVRIDGAVDQETGWHKWSVSYVLGPHAITDGHKGATISESPNGQATVAGNDDDFSACGTKET
jgi:hypothetical protein